MSFEDYLADILGEGESDYLDKEFSLRQSKQRIEVIRSFVFKVNALGVVAKPAYYFFCSAQIFISIFNTIIKRRL